MWHTGPLKQTVFEEIRSYNRVGRVFLRITTTGPSQWEPRWLTRWVTTSAWTTTTRVAALVLETAASWPQRSGENRGGGKGGRWDGGCQGKIHNDTVLFYRPRLSYTCVSEQMINLQHDDQTINEEKPRDSDRTQTIKLFLSKKKNSFTTFVEIQTPRCTLNKKFQWTRDKSQTSETPLTKYPQKDLYLYIFWGVLKDFPIQTISFFPISNLLPISIIYIWLKVFITMFSWRGCWRLLPHVDQKCAKK